VRREWTSTAGIAVLSSAVAVAFLFSRAESTRDQSAEDIVFIGMCDASGAIALDDHLFAIADDEDNVIRIYDANVGGTPLEMRDLSSGLNLPEKKKKKAKKKKHPKKHFRMPETDVEAATRIGNIALWMTSHGRTESGRLRLERVRFFATTATEADDMSMIGQPYEGLLDDIVASPALIDLGVSRAAALPAKDGGLNIEGMTARPEGGVIIGFRSPLIERRAILVPIENPLELMRGARAQLGEPVQLDLGGAGVRALSWWRGRYWILAGGPVGPPRLYSWRPPAVPQQIPSVTLDGLNPEAFFTPEDRAEIMILSDDGTVEIDGRPCKRLKEKSLKRFRGRWIKPDEVTL
jgi:hypothetical protein